MARITGLATGLDVDTIIKQTMQAYRTKIDTQQQKKDILEIKQKLYRDVITDTQKLYNTHFDVLKSGSLISSKTWQSVKFISSNESAVTVTGSSSAKTGNYTVSGSKAKAASVTLTEKELKETITINGKEFKVEGSTNKEKASNLNKALSNAGVNVSVRYTDFKNSKGKSGFIFESKVLGQTGNFIIGATSGQSDTGVDATVAKITGLTVNMLKSNAIYNEAEKVNEVTFKIGEKDITIDISDLSSNDSVRDLLNKALSKAELGYMANIDNTGNVTLTSTKSGKLTPIPTVTIEDKTEGTINLSFENGKDAVKAEAKLNSDKDSGDLNKSIVINGVKVNLSLGGTELEDKVQYINNILKGKSVEVTASNENGTIILKSNSVGKDTQVNIFVLNGGEVSTGGIDGKFTIEDNKGGVYTHNGNTNSVTLDGITFNFTGEIPSGEKISITSKVDASEIVEKVKSYIEDYNALIVKINTLTSEKRDRGYQPLTADQKKEMSEKEIELWESKVKQGQLKGDSDLRRIVNSLKQGMKTMVSGTGLTLEDIGIESVQDYGGTKDGTFKINEDTLKKAIEDDTEGVMKLFMQSAPSEDLETDKYNKNGIMNRLKDILYKETVTSQSILLQKVGFEGTTTVANNAITKSMEAYTKKISDMENLFSTKEQTLYSKYAKLETLMNNYNSQMSYLSQTLGLSTS